MGQIARKEEIPVLAGATAVTAALLSPPSPHRNPPQAHPPRLLTVSSPLGLPTPGSPSAPPPPSTLLPHAPSLFLLPSGSPPLVSRDEVRAGGAAAAAAAVEVTEAVAAEAAPSAVRPRCGRSRGSAESPRPSPVRALPPSLGMEKATVPVAAVAAAAEGEGSPPAVAAIAGPPAAAAAAEVGDGSGARSASSPRGMVRVCDLLLKKKPPQQQHHKAKRNRTCRPPSSSESSSDSDNSGGGGGTSSNNSEEEEDDDDEEEEVSEARAWFQRKAGGGVCKGWEGGKGLAVGLIPAGRALLGARLSTALFLSRPNP